MFPVVCACVHVSACACVPACECVTSIQVSLKAPTHLFEINYQCICTQLLLIYCVYLSHVVYTTTCSNTFDMYLHYSQTCFWYVLAVHTRYVAFCTCARRYVCQNVYPCHEGPPATRGHFGSEPAVSPRGRYYCTWICGTALWGTKTCTCEMACI